jgi:diguanylate cyclase (GGDEF)-like protein
MAGEIETNGSAESMRRLAEENALLRASVAELRDRMTQLEALADTDTLTPLPNRRRFLRELERAVAQASRHGTPAAMLYVDLDSLKTINDLHGHFAGDAALVHVAKLLSGLIRSTDIAARIGGDEFALLLDHLDLESAIDTAERIARCISSTPLDLGGTLIELQASIGTAAILAGDSVEDVMQRADRNMYVAKAEA